MARIAVFGAGYAGLVSGACFASLGHSVVANDQPIDPTNRFYFAGLPQRPFDLDKAKFHLQKANLGQAPLPVVARLSVAPVAPAMSRLFLVHW